MQETCKKYVSIVEDDGSPNQIECGLPAVSAATAKLTPRGDEARVPLCKKHKSEMNQYFAERRAARRRLTPKRSRTTPSRKDEA